MTDENTKDENAKDVTETGMAADRAEQLLKAMVDAMFNGPFINLAEATDEEKINYLFALDFYEEEMIEYFGIGEERIDAANEALG